MENADYKVSILIPVYNVRNFILHCLESVAAQTFTGALECIIVDDCGTDDSIEIAEKFMDSYQGNIFFRIIHHDHNRGLAAARNTAVANAKGDFIFHLDSDDWIEPYAIERLFLLQLETDADIVSGNALIHGPKGEIILQERNYDSPTEMVYNTVNMTLDHVIWKRLIRRSLYIENGIVAVEGVNVGEDNYTLPKLAYYAKKISQLDETIYHYNCLNTNSYMAPNKKTYLARVESNLKSLDILLDFFSDKDTKCCKKLRTIKREYLKICLRSEAALNDKNIFYEISRKKKGIYYYPVYKGFVKTMRTIKKFRKG